MMSDYILYFFCFCMAWMGICTVVLAIVSSIGKSFIEEEKNDGMDN